MLYRCEDCGHIEARGWLPTTTCSLFWIFSGSLVLGCAGTPIQVFLGLPSLPEWGAWWLMLIPLSFLLLVPTMVIGYFMHYYVFAFVEWTVYCIRRCPKCKARSWSWGFTRGLGL